MRRRATPRGRVHTFGGRQRPGRPHTRIVPALAAVVAAAAVLFGGRALRLELPVIFRDAPPNAIPSPFRNQMEIVIRKVPPGAYVLHLSSVDESWYSRMWERALYPRNPVVYLQPPALDPASLRRACERYGTRFAISVGNPSPGPGYLWSVAMGELPGPTEQSWFGELAP